MFKLRNIFCCFWCKQTQHISPLTRLNKLQCLIGHVISRKMSSSHDGTRGTCARWNSHVVIACQHLEPGVQSQSNMHITQSPLQFGKTLHVSIQFNLIKFVVVFSASMDITTFLWQICNTPHLERNMFLNPVSEVWIHT